MNQTLSNNFPTLSEYGEDATLKAWPKMRLVEHSQLSYSRYCVVAITLERNSFVQSFISWKSLHCGVVFNRLPETCSDEKTGKVLCADTKRVFKSLLFPISKQANIY